MKEDNLFSSLKRLDPKYHCWCDDLVEEAERMIYSLKKSFQNGFLRRVIKLTFPFFRLFHYLSASLLYRAKL